MKLLVVINGESNSGGYALNVEADLSELGRRTSVKILDNESLEAFVTLNIGENNLSGHYNLPCGTTHGFELELANRADVKEIYDRPCYLVKTGQGGSKIAEWALGENYFNLFLSRVNSAVKLLGNQTYRTVVLFSQGINDAIAGTDPTIWNQSVIAHFLNMRSIIGEDTPIILTGLMSEFTAYNKVIFELGNELTGVYPVYTEDAQLRNKYHWNYAGMKLVTGRMLDVLEKLLRNSQKITGWNLKAKL